VFSVGLRVKLWIQAIRAYSFSASIIPVFISAILAYKDGFSVNFLYLIMILIGVVSLHAAINMVNDYYDYKNGVDKISTHGSSRVLVDGLLGMKQVLKAIWIAYFIAGLVAVYFIFLFGLPIVCFVILGLAGGYLYTGGPFAAKYYALGEVWVFMLMGPLLFLGSFYALTGMFSMDVLLISIPFGLLTTAIMSANNLRDIYDDEQVGVKTLANIFGMNFARCFYVFLILFSYLFIIILVLLKLFSVGLLFSMLSIFPFLVIFRQLFVTGFEPVTVANNEIVEKTAKLQLLFFVFSVFGLIL
jgi:1,4-dihydroxy-2-naphthoate polyprenyltransferase